MFTGKERKYEFFYGFLVFVHFVCNFFCIYIFLKEEIKKNKFNNIIPGQSYYVQSIGKVIVQDTDGITVVYSDAQENTYSVSCVLFAAVSKLSLKEANPIRIADIKPKSSKKQAHQYYDKKGSIFDVYVD